ncbi:hypothetical protein, partial [Mycolicibacterium pulveris]
MREPLRAMRTFTPTAILVGAYCVIGVSVAQVDDQERENFSHATGSATGLIAVSPVNAHRPLVQSRPIDEKQHSEEGREGDDDHGGDGHEHDHDHGGEDEDGGDGHDHDHDH